jgi:hypothetical protein
MKWKLLGTNIANTLSWKKHVDQLGTAWYGIRTVKSYANQGTLLIAYYAYFHSIMHYGIIIWGNSSNATDVFHVQKRALRIMMDIGSIDSCRQLFKTLGILTLQSQYIYSLLCFMVKNMNSYQLISDIHNRNARQGYNISLYKPSAHLSLYQKRVCCMGSKVLNNLPVYIRLYNNCKGLTWLWKYSYVATRFIYQKNILILNMTKINILFEEWCLLGCYAVRLL